MWPKTVKRVGMKNHLWFHWVEIVKICLNKHKFNLPFVFSAVNSFFIKMNGLLSLNFTPLPQSFRYELPLDLAPCFSSFNILKNKIMYYELHGDNTSSPVCVDMWYCN